MKTCLKCGKEAPDAAVTCECGYRFAVSVVAAWPIPETSPAAEKSPAHTMSGFGLVMFIMGWIAMGYAGLIYDATVGSSSSEGLFDTSQRIFNTGLLQKQLLIFLFGAFAMLAGTVMWAAGLICATVQRSAEKP